MEAGRGTRFAESEWVISTSSVDLSTFKLKPFKLVNFSWDKGPFGIQVKLMIPSQNNALVKNIYIYIIKETNYIENLLKD